MGTDVYATNIAISLSATDCDTNVFLNTLEKYMLQKTEEDGVIIQLDGTPLHYAKTVHELPNNIF
jgi:hypothetical protein